VEFPLALNNRFLESNRENFSEKESAIEFARDLKFPFCFGFFLTSEGRA
jgi:hypothetical protein